jgi:hypothetical protein
MFVFLAQNWGTIVIGAIIAFAIGATVYHLYRNGKKGKKSCGCGCDHCAMSGYCHTKSATKK